VQWEELFQEHILDRGFVYYEQGRVKNLKVTTRLLKAEVEGSQIYEVGIDYSQFDKKITQLHCDCPHFASGYFCKHLAAFLFYLENKFNDFNDLKISLSDIYSLPNIKENREEEAKELVAEADNATVRAFLTDVLIENNHLKEQFEASLKREITDQKMKEYKRDIDNLFKRHSEGVDGFIDYDSANELGDDLSGFRHKVIEQILLKNGFYKEAFALTNHIFMKLATHSMDDSGGVILNNVYVFQNYWATMILQSSLAFKRDMYAWFKEQLSNSAVNKLKRYIEEMLFDYFTEEEFLVDKKAFAKRGFEDFKQADGYQSQKIGAPHWAERYLEVLEDLGHESEFDEFCQNNLKYARVREMYVDHLVERKQLEKAIRLLEDQDSEISREYKIKLKDLYKEAGRQKDYQNELWDLLMNQPVIDEDLYAEYRTLYSPEAWEENKIDVLEELSSAHNIADLYAEEELYDLLLESVVNTHGLSSLQKYEKRLVKKYPEEVLDRYEKEILKMAELAGPRKKYRKIVDLLRRIQRLSNGKGKQRVADLATKLREFYNNRPAMMDELRKL